jgi:hypothetical protein
LRHNTWTERHIDDDLSVTKLLKFFIHNEIYAYKNRNRGLMMLRLIWLKITDYYIFGLICLKIKL